MNSDLPNKTRSGYPICIITFDVFYEQPLLLFMNSPSKLDDMNSPFLFYEQHLLLYSMNSPRLLMGVLLHIAIISIFRWCSLTLS